MQPSPHLSTSPVTTNSVTISPVTTNPVSTSIQHTIANEAGEPKPIDKDFYQNLVYQTPLRAHVKSAVYQYLKELDGQQPTNLYDTFLQEIEKPLIEVVLEQTHGNQSKACLILGINRGTLRKKMQLYGLL